MGNQVKFPDSFPVSNYTPHGYIDNPYHSMVLNRSGVIRSVPPLGFGWWHRSFNGSYGEGPRGHVNYLSFLQMSVVVDGKSFVSSEDFVRSESDLISKYHTKNVMTYDWKFESLAFSLKYFLPGENTLTCLIEIANSGNTEKTVSIHATNIYGLWETQWWGSDGIAASYSDEADVSISKIWAYGDVFALGADIQSETHKSTGSEEQWESWIREDDISSIDEITVHGSGPLWMTHCYKFNVPANGASSALICLSRSQNELWALKELKTGLEKSIPLLREKLSEDETFWSGCPMLKGDWPESWKHGWVYDWETLRMNVRNPMGIYEHHWDAMQVHSPRAVLGESALDMMALSYADTELAKDVLLGVFADAPMPNVPCSREDGSMNMIAADGSECGTSPVWGLPFHVLLSVYTRTLDKEWIRELYPYLKSFLEWWLENRTDDDGWFHCKCSWESGQDGSKRFLIPGHDPGGVAEFVRTVDVEAVMAEAMKNMVIFAEIAGQPEEREYWQNLADERIRTTRDMYVDGWFRDFDVRTNLPIILEDYVDIMMLVPLSCGIAAPEQIEAIKPKFQYFKENSRYWLEWPSFVFPFSEAAWNAGLRTFVANILADIADRIYSRTDSKTISFKDENEAFSHRIPGIANEFWPIDKQPAGGENYGWGATLPMDVIRSIMGFRETENLSNTEFILAPAIPDKLLQPGKEYKMTNLSHKGVISDVTYCIVDSEKVNVVLDYRSEQPVTASIRDDSGEIIAYQNEKVGNGSISFDGLNGCVYMVEFELNWRPGIERIICNESGNCNTHDCVFRNTFGD